MRRNIFVTTGIAFATALLLSLMFSPGQALVTDGRSLRCVRFISAPLIGWHEVPIWYPRVYAGGLLVLFLFTTTLLSLAWRHSLNYREQAFGLTTGSMSSIGIFH